MARCRKLCFQINTTEPEREDIFSIEKELFSAGLPEGSYFTPPFQIDYANQMTIGEKVFANHDLKDLQILKCKSVTVKKGAWIGANVTILPGVTIGEGAVIGSASVVTKDVAPHTVAAGNPARYIKEIE